ncbi:MAG: tandem-95 repeat protein, partial [Candidatus Atribacteria bacterium]
ATDGNGGQAVAVVTVLVAPVNDPPIAQDDSASVEEDTPRVINVLDNDADPDGDDLSIHSATQPAHGTVSTNGSELTYTPGPDFSGVDVFSYTAADGKGGTSVAIVTVTVVEINDAPVALDDGTSTPEDTSVLIDVLANDFDPENDILAVESVTQPEHGTVVNEGSAVTYVPDSNFHGEDSFTYTACDDNGGKATAIVYVTVVPTNDPPVAQDDSDSTDEDASITLDVLSNDFDLDGDDLVILAATQPSNGSVVNRGTDLVYTPSEDFNGVDIFEYTISDGGGETSTATVTMTVRAINDPPLARDDETTTDEETPIRIEVLLNDTDPDEDALSIEAVTLPAHGVVVKAGTAIEYTPTSNYSGPDSLTYTISDGSGGTSTATVSIRVLPVNDPPTAQDDSATTEEDTLVSIAVLSNDSDPDGDFLLVEAVSAPSNGTIINAQTSVSYIPNPEFSGLDSFTYTVTDSSGSTATATVTLAVSAVNDPPIAQDDSGITDEGTALSIAVLSNDIDPDGDTLVIQSVGQPTNGSTAKDGQAIVYTPSSEFNGVDSFSYTASDGHGGTATATVTIAVAAVNDPPIAQDDSGATEEATSVALAVLLNDSDLDGDRLTIQSVTTPANGSVINDGAEVTYTPNADFSGLDTFTYTISDGNGELASATVTVAVAAVNDPPIAQDDAASTNEETAVVIDVLINDSDPDGDTLAIQSVAQPSRGSAVNQGADVMYMPDANFTGTDVFTYTVSDGHGKIATATVTVLVVAVNDPPVAQDDSESTPEDTAVTIDVLHNDIDPDGDGLVIQSVAQPANGTATVGEAAIIYTPNPSFSGVDSFTYTISDGNGETALATVTVAVAAVNDPPTALDDLAITGEDSSVTILVLPNDSDPENDVLSIQSITQPLHGTAVGNATSVIYTPDPNYVGPDSFTYTISDGRGGTATAQVAVTVLPINDAPIAQDDS